MYNVDLRRKRCILPGKEYEEKNMISACFNAYINYLSGSALSSKDSISNIAQVHHFRKPQIPKYQN